jgi:phage terminase small subunit
MAKRKTAKRQRFIDCYAGNIKEAADKAEISYGYARNLMTKSDILEAIRNRQETEVRPKDIADRQERQAFWTKTMNDDEQSMSDRLRASELLGKSEADFTDKLRHEVAPQSLADIAAIMASQRHRVKRREIASEPLLQIEGTESP